MLTRDRNFLYTKKFFWFGSESLSAKDLAAYVKSEKATDVAHHVVSWASETGKGLLLYGEKAGDKSSAHGVIQLVCSMTLVELYFVDALSNSCSH